MTLPTAQDHGVRDAIDKGYLKQLVMAVFVDPEDSTNVLETYTCVARNARWL